MRVDSSQDTCLRFHGTEGHVVIRRKPSEFPFKIESTVVLPSDPKFGGKVSTALMSGERDAKTE
jgi:hypothetical protein